MKDILHTEETYSSFYKAQLRLLIHDDYARVEGSVNKYCEHVLRQLFKADACDVLVDFPEHWYHNIDGGNPPFCGPNLRTFLKGNTDSNITVWKVLDLYMKFTQPLLVKACKLEGYLERLGLTVSEFVHPVQSEHPPALKQHGLFSCEMNDSGKLYLDIHALPERRYALVHLVHVHISPEQDQTILEGLQDHRTRIDKGVCIPQAQNDLLIIRDIESADVSFGFTTKLGDKICCHRVLLDGSVETHIFVPDESDTIKTMIKAASFKDEEAL